VAALRTKQMCINHAGLRWRQATWCELSQDECDAITDCDVLYQFTVATRYRHALGLMSPFATVDELCYGITRETVDLEVVFEVDGVETTFTALKVAVHAHASLEVTQWLMALEPSDEHVHEAAIHAVRRGDHKRVCRSIIFPLTVH